MIDFLLQTIWLIPCYALIGALLSVFWLPSITRRTGPRPAGYVNLIMTLFAFLHGVVVLPSVWNQPVQELFIPWLQVANLDLTLSVMISPVTVGATVVITGINLLAQLYAVGYMEMDWGWARFYSLLALFEGGMCLLVLCDSLFFAYIVLEILTLGTYLLVGLWFNQPMVVTGARDAFLTKRVGDLFLLMGVVALLPIAGTWDFSELATWAQSAAAQDFVTAHPLAMTLVCLALIAGPMGKCAQFPLHLWLDEAMEGPVPSTILRNSVVVAVGAWALIKLEPVLGLSPWSVTAMITIGAVTAVGASLIAIAQIDVKRTLSYPVSAYMGLIFIAVGTGQDEAAFMLLLAHAFGMALLVMAVGTIVWNSVTQDVTQLGGLWSRRPISGLAFVVGALGLVAFPPLGGFWALLQLASSIWTTYPWLVGLILVVNGLTAFSLVRVFGLIWGGKPKQMSERSPEVHWPMVLPMVVMLGFTLHLPLIMQAFSLLPAWVTLNKEVALLLIWSTIFGLSLGGIVYLGSWWPKPVSLIWQPLRDLLAYDFYTPKIYRMSVVFGVDLISRLTDWLDRYFVDGLVNLTGLATIFGGQGLKYSTTGQSQTYVLTILLGIALACFLAFRLL